MNNYKKIDRIGVIMVWVLYIIISILIILFLRADPARGFEARVFNFKWDRVENIDDYYISVDVEKADGGTDDYSATIKGITEYKADLKVGDKHIIKIIPILPGGAHGDVMVEMIITPGLEPTRTISE